MIAVFIPFELVLKEIVKGIRPPGTRVPVDSPVAEYAGSPVNDASSIINVSHPRFSIYPDCDCVGEQIVSGGKIICNGLAESIPAPRQPESPSTTTSPHTLLSEVFDV